MSKQLAIIGDFDSNKETHLATNHAIDHSISMLSIDLNYEWILTNQIDPADFYQFDGFWIAPGSPYQDPLSVLKVIRYAREEKIPCLGTCGGFQHIMMEYAHAYLGIKDPGHEEYGKGRSHLFISQLVCSLVGQTLEIQIKPGTLAHTAYEELTISEKYYCNFGINPTYMDRIQEGPITLSGTDSGGEIRIVEYPGHPFMVATLFVPQSQSTLAKPHPLIINFLKAITKTD